MSNRRPQWPEGERVGRAEVVVYRGITFRRYPEALDFTNRNYFRPAGADRRNGVANLHQEIYRDAYGPVPEGHEIHHVDHNPLNNHPENLVAFSREDHHNHHAVDEATLERRRLRREVLDRIRAQAVPWHSTEAGRRWHSLNARRQWAAVAPRDCICTQCQQTYTTRDFTKTRFCSPRCKAAWRRAQGLDNEERTCAFCGKPFSANRYEPTRYCGKTCAQRHRAGHPKP